MVKDKICVLQCECTSTEHNVIVGIFDGEKKLNSEPYLYMNVFLRGDTILKRIWIGIKYILGYKCKYGHWDEVMFNEETADKLEKLLTEYKNACKKYKK